MSLLMGQLTLPIHWLPERVQRAGAYGVTRGLPVIGPVMVRVKIQFPVAPRRTASALQVLAGVVGTGVTKLLVQLALDPPGPSIVAENVELVMVGQLAVPAHWLAFQFPVAAGDRAGCLVESMIPDPLIVNEHDAVDPCLVAVKVHPGGCNLGTEVVQVAEPLGPTTVAINSASFVWLHLTILLAGMLPSQFTELPAIEKLETVPAPDVLVRV